MTSNELIQMYTVEKTVSIMLGIKIFRNSAFLMCFLCKLSFLNDHCQIIKNTTYVKEC